MLKILSIDRTIGTLIAVCDKCNYQTGTIAMSNPRRLRFHRCPRCEDVDGSEGDALKTD